MRRQMAHTTKQGEGPGHMGIAGAAYLSGADDQDPALDNWDGVSADSDPENFSDCETRDE